MFFLSELIAKMNSKFIFKFRTMKLGYTSKSSKMISITNVQTILRSSAGQKKKSKLVVTHTNQKHSRYLQNYTAKER